MSFQNTALVLASSVSTALDELKSHLLQVGIRVCSTRSYQDLLMTLQVMIKNKKALEHSVLILQENNPDCDVYKVVETIEMSVSIPFAKICVVSEGLMLDRAKWKELDVLAYSLLSDKPSQIVEHLNVYLPKGTSSAFVPTGDHGPPSHRTTS